MMTNREKEDMAIGEIVIAKGSSFRDSVAEFVVTVLVVDYH